MYLIFHPSTSDLSLPKKHIDPNKGKKMLTIDFLPTFELVLSGTKPGVLDSSAMRVPWGIYTGVFLPLFFLLLGHLHT